MEFIGIIFFLGVLTASNEALACSYNAHVNGPSLVCPSTTYEFWTDIPPEIFCGSYTVEEWSITVGQGYAHFVDQSGNDLGSYLVCDQYTPNAPCRPSGIVRIRTNSYYGSFGYRVVGHCSQAGTATRDYTVAIGLPPPNSISGPADECVGNIMAAWDD